MYRFAILERDETTLHPIAGVSISVLDYTGQTAATLFDDAGNPLLQPLTSDALGQAYFNVANPANYQLRHVYNGETVKVETVTAGPFVAAVNPSPDNAGKYLALDANGYATYASGTGNDSALRTDLAASGGSALSGYKASLLASAESIQAALRRLPIFPEQFGAVGDGTANDTAAFQAAVDEGAATKREVYGAGRYKITAAINLSDYSQITFAPYAQLVTATTNISFLLAGSKTGIRIKGVWFKQTAVGANPYAGGVSLDTCTNSIVEECRFEGMQWAGVYLSNSSYCTVRKNFFTGFLGTVADSCDICLYNASTFNKISENHCLGGGHHGILLQDPYAGLSPAKNIIGHNTIGQHKNYGIAVYVPTAGDTGNTITGNFIENIQGSIGAGDGGCAIYVVGAGAGGTTITDNTARNCNVVTATRSLAPGVIGISGLSATNAGVTIAGNTIFDVGHYDGIHVTGGAGAPITVTGNTVTMPTGNTTGDPIRVENANNVAVTGNVVKRANAAVGDARCIVIYANGQEMKGVVVANNVCDGAATRSIEFLIATTGFFTRPVVSGNTVGGMRTGGVAAYFDKLRDASITGNTFESPDAAAVTLSASTNTRISGGSMKTAGTNAFVTIGTCTGSYMDATVALTGLVSNAGTGCIVERLVTAIPTTGTGAVGDKAIQSVPTASNPDYWRCVTAGTPGTWKAGASLAA